MGHRFSLAERARCTSVARGEAVQAMVRAPGPSLSVDAVRDLSDAWASRCSARYVGLQLTGEELAEELHRLSACTRMLADDADRLAVSDEAALWASGYALALERAAALVGLLARTGVPR